ncbi:hypothetical protein D9Q98_006851 [Chlorella vulgaris]|uniref:CCHC-type domain-containing protein n=1 Tax=Chlorella vulgaris TaxID=3077 RepID=A0A9D4TIZ0_CHLVU|nr:hypothetical protein D9Q98_006851 [Chlorella vulgaris]
MAPKGCYKCGLTGHWSRDCTAPKSQWVARPPGQGPPGQGRTPGAGGATPALANAKAAENDPFNPEGGLLEPGAEQQTAAAARKEKRKRPKLTLELLQTSKGLPDVAANFPAAFRRQFRGRGHEASDLRRLLEMYKRWQDRVFPHGEFDAFICGVERLSGTNAVKSHMHDQRMRMLKEVQDIADPPHVHLESEAGAAVAGGESGAAATRGLAAGDELDGLGSGDEHMGLAAEAAPPAAATAAPGTGQAHTAEEEAELLALLDAEEEHYREMEQQYAAQQAQHAAAPAAAGPAAAEVQVEEEEDEAALLALLDAGDEEEEEAPAAASPVAAAPAISPDDAAAAAGVAAMSTQEREELLALLDAEEEEEEDEAGQAAKKSTQEAEQEQQGDPAMVAGGGTVVADRAEPAQPPQPLDASGQVQPMADGELASLPQQPATADVEMVDRDEVSQQAEEDSQAGQAGQPPPATRFEPSIELAATPDTAADAEEGLAGVLEASIELGVVPDTADGEVPAEAGEEAAGEAAAAAAAEAMAEAAAAAAAEAMEEQGAGGVQGGLLEKEQSPSSCGGGAGGPSQEL